jgi:hypothetical protein
MKLKPSLVVLAAAVLLVACSDNPREDVATPQAGNEVPASATATTLAYAQYAGSLPKTETQQPLDVRKVTPPTSETEEPQPI